MTDAEVRLLRARAQRLVDPAPPGAPTEAVRALLAAQAQAPAATALGLRARTAGLRAGDVRRAVDERRELVRTWLMRGTLHLVAAEDLPWLVDLLGPLFAGITRRDRQLGLDEGVVERGTAALRDILAASGPLTGQELVRRLAARGLALDARSQAPIHLVRHAALRGVLCLGPERSAGRPTYVLVEDWIGRPRAFAAERAAAELARRYLAAFGPATDNDLAAWSGMPLAMVRSALGAIAGEVVEVEVRGRRAWMPAGARAAPAAGRPSVRLLPAFDDYLLGYRSRDLGVPRELQSRLQRGGGWVHPAVLVDGLAVAAWSARTSARRTVVTVEATARALGDETVAGVEAEVRDIARFTGTETLLRLAAP